MKSKLKDEVNMKSKLKEIDYFTDDELINVSVGDAFAFDIECYPNYFLIAFKHIVSKKVVVFILSENSNINITKLEWMLSRFLIIGFNSINYDIPMICKSMQSLSCKELKQVSNTIINENVRSWQSENVLKYTTPIYLNHIDLIEVCPLDGSLKTYGARLHSERLQDLPYKPDVELSKIEQDEVMQYCINDLDVTILILENLKEQLDLRVNMSKKYNVDLRSKSDAQIAETLICKEIQKIKGFYPKKPKIQNGVAYKYIAPDYLRFQTKQFKHMFDVVLNSEFVINDNGSPNLPNELENLIITCGKSSYKLGIGGLHSTESSIAHTVGKDEIMEDIDVESYYPRIILNNKYYPEHIGVEFLTIYDNFVETRLAAKHNKDKSTSDSLKIVINGSFGKLGSKYSALYAPDLLIQVTITGQLSLLMLIEMLELNDVSVVSANTDGIVLKYTNDKMELVGNVVKQWEGACNFVTEKTEYSGLYSRDVNNYIAVKSDLTCKTKGAFSNPWGNKNPDIFIFHKNPVSTICIEAMVNLITKKIPIEDTIKNCTDIKKFIVVRGVKGGGVYKDTYLGKVVRWYYADGEYGSFNYAMSGNKVPLSDGATPCMDLSEKFPDNICYERYISDTTSMLYDCGYLIKPTTGVLW